MSFRKKIRYESRKQLAEARPRVKGQFVRAESLPQGSAGEHIGKGVQRMNLDRLPESVWRTICARACIAELQTPLCRQAFCSELALSLYGASAHWHLLRHQKPDTASQAFCASSGHGSALSA